MKTLLISLVALIILGGGAVGGYLYFQSAEAGSGEDAGASAAHDDGHKAEIGTDQTIMVKVDPIILPIIGDEGVTQTVTILVTIETYNTAQATSIREAMPRLRDTYLMHLYGQLYAHTVIEENGILKVDVIKRRLIGLTSKVIDSDMFHDVLIEFIQQRRV